MTRMKMPRLSIPCLLAVAVAGAVVPAATARDSLKNVLRDLNATPAVVGSDEIKSYPVIFAAYLDLSEPPMDVGDDFNLLTIHPGMDEWSRVSGWGESNNAMAKAILAVEEKTLFGLPYGAGNVKPEFKSAGLMADVGRDGSLRDNVFPYLDAIDTIAAFATAESYRLAEAGQGDDAIDLMVATVFLMRQCCDRAFMLEQLHAVRLASNALSNLRDMAYTYQDKISPDKFAEVAIQKLPYLRPDRSRLLLPEGDRRVAEALVDEVFDARGQPHRDKFPATFASIQSKDVPLTHFGAAKRWRMIAEVHDSQEASMERLTLIYDDWFRRWRVAAYDPILALPTEFERTNPVRYAAVIYSTQDVDRLFAARDLLLVSVYGSAMSLGLSGYKERSGTYPSLTDAMYATFVRKRSDADPFDIEGGTFKYRVLGRTFRIDSQYGEIEVESGEALLYSRGQDHEDDRGAIHRIDGSDGDLVVWPPLRALAREQGLLD
jgi:hypothetical protein